MAKVNFFVEDLQLDLITHINSIPLAPAPMSAVDWCNANLGIYWIEQTKRGYAMLCTNLPDFVDQELTMERTDTSTYLTTTCDFVGGHPIRRPIGF